jgi:hypothetical protein
LQGFFIALVLDLVDENVLHEVTPSIKADEASAGRNELARRFRED